MFVWGAGTSTVGEDSLDWGETVSATALAVGTIVIPAIDAFFNSQRFEQWIDKVRAIRSACRSLGTLVRILQHGNHYE